MLNSGCTQHIGNSQMFTSLEEEDNSSNKITFGDNSKGNVIGLRKVAISDVLNLLVSIYFRLLKFII